MPRPAAAVAVGIAYWLAAYFSLKVSLVGGIVSPIWPPTGIALVGFLLLGRGIWPAVTAAAFLVNTPHVPPAAAVVIAAGNTFAPLLAAVLMERAGFRPGMDRLKDAVSIVSLGALLAMTVSATFGTTALLLSSIIAPAEYPATWAVWWAGDATGVLLFAPLLLSIRFGKPVFSWGRAGEGLFLFAAVAALAVWVFWGPLPLEYLLFPVLVWAGVRFGSLGGSFAALISAAAAIAAAVNQAGPFEGRGLLEAMLSLQVFNAGAALTSLVAAAISKERARANEALKEAADKLQRRVAERSAQLASAEQRLESERRIAETLQRSLLPERLPEIPGVAVAARYLPGADGLDVGGDWYDVFPLADGQVALAIGDVVGRGLRAAASMGQLRTALRAYALDSSSTSQVIERLNRLVQTLGAAEMATALYAVLDPVANTISMSSAGHPPPLVVKPEGESSYVELDTSAPLGVPGRAVKEAAITLEPGSTLLLYTDGLVERRGAGIDEGMSRLQASVRDHSGDIDSLCDHALIGGLGAEAPKDDVAILAVRLEPLPSGSFHIELEADGKVLSLARRALRKWLERHGADEDEADDLVLAAGEALTNVLEHAYGPSGGAVELEAHAGEGAVTIIVRDFGSWRQRRKDDRGRGFLLMNSLTDTIDVVTTRKGTEVRLRRTLGAALKGSGDGSGPPGPIASADTGNICVLELNPELDVDSVEGVSESLSAAVGNQDLGVVLDMSKMLYIDSAGIQILFQLASRLKAHRQQLRLVMSEMSPIRKVISLIELDKVAPVLPTVEKAVEDIKAAQRALETAWPEFEGI